MAIIKNQLGNFCKINNTEFEKKTYICQQKKIRNDIV